MLIDVLYRPRNIGWKDNEKILNFLDLNVNFMIGFSL